MINMITTDISNTLLSYMLIYGFLGIPALGILGAGVAISIAWTIGCLLSLAFVIKGVGFLRYDVRRALFIDFGTIKRIMTVGFPAAIEQFQMQIAFTLFSVIISGLGTTVYAAHMVALRVENIAFMPGFALGVAATTLVGQALGAGRTDLAQRSAKIAQWYAIGLMTIVGILMGVFRTELMSVFVSDKEVIEIGTMAMIIYAFSMPFMGTSNCLAGSLRGAGDTRAVLMIMSSGIWLIRLPLAYILAYWFGFGAVGAWSAAVVDLDMRGILAWWRFTSGHWKTIRV